MCLLTKMMTKIFFCFYILPLQIIFSVNGKDQKGFLCLMLSSIFRGWRKLSKLDFSTGNFTTGNFLKGTFPSGTFSKRTFPTGRELFQRELFPRDGNFSHGNFSHGTYGIFHFQTFSCSGISQNSRGKFWWNKKRTISAGKLPWEKSIWVNSQGKVLIN